MEWVKVFAFIGFGLAIMLIWQNLALKEFQKDWESKND